MIFLSGELIVQLVPVPTSQRWTETGSNLVLECNTTSSTYPSSHGLSMHIKWSRNGVKLTNQGKLYVLQNLTKSDNGTVISCEAKEEKGHKSTSNFSLLVHCKSSETLYLAELFSSFGCFIFIGSPSRSFLL